MNKVFFILLLLMVFSFNQSFAGETKSDKFISFNPQTGKFNKATYVSRPQSSNPVTSLLTNVVLKKTLVTILKVDHMILQTSLGHLVLVKKGKEIYLLNEETKNMRKIVCNWEKLLFSAPNQKISVLVEDNVIDEIDVFENDSDDLI